MVVPRQLGHQPDSAGGTLGTVLAASGFFSEVVPGLSTGTYVGFNLFYVALALLAPLVFQAFYY